MLQIPISGIKKIEEIASSPEYISLSQGSIKVGGIPHQIKNYIRELLNTDKTDYYGSCWGISILRERLAETLSKEYNTTISVNQVIPTHGCIGGLSLIYLTLLEAGDEVIIPEPSYPAYTILAQASRAKAVCIPSLVSTNPVNWTLDVEKIKEATTEKTKLIIFSNPWNPLGIIVSPEIIKELISWCESKGIYLVIDEAYRNYVFEGEFLSSLELINKSEFVISANTFSKNMSMSGWRVGYLVVPEKLSRSLASMQDALLNCLNNISQYAALYAVNHPELERYFYDKILYNRNQALTQLQPLFDEKIFSCEIPNGGFFLFLKTDQRDAGDLVFSILNKAKVGLIPGSSFGPTGMSFLRLCYARESEILEEGIDRLLNYFL